MSQAQCEYCGQEERYGHNAICVMNTVAELRAEIERLTKERDLALANADGVCARLMPEIERQRTLLQKIKDRGQLMDLGLINEIDACLDPEGYRNIFDHQQSPSAEKSK